MRYKRWAGIAAGIALGLIFAAAGLGKLLHQPEAISVFFNPAPDLLTAAIFKFFFTWLPRIELVLGLLLIIGVAARLIATISSVLRLLVSSPTLAGCSVRVWETSPAAVSAGQKE